MARGRALRLRPPPGSARPAALLPATRGGGNGIGREISSCVFATTDTRCSDNTAPGGSTRPLPGLGVVQEQIADSWIEIEQFRLLVLRTAWKIDRYQDYRKVRKDIAAVKVAMPKVYHDIVQRAMHLHGALGVSNEMPFTRMMVAAEVMGIADGPTEVHKTTVARQVLRDYEAVDGLWPSAHLPTRKAAAREKYRHLLEHEVGNL